VSAARVSAVRVSAVRVSDSIRLDGRVALVTGAGRGLGRAYAIELARRGAAVVVNDPGVNPRGDDAGDRAAANSVVAEIAAAGGRAVADYGNVADPQAAQAMVARAAEAFGGLDVVVNNAGNNRRNTFADTTLADFRQMIEINALTCFLCCREAVRKIRGSNSGGRIVNVASKPAVIPAAGLCAYAASKATVANLTLSLSEELAAERIWVNAVVPSIMDTPANRQAMPKADFSKWPKLNEVAATIVYLASPQNAVTRGALVPVYGEV